VLGRHGRPLPAAKRAGDGEGRDVVRRSRREEGRQNVGRRADADVVVGHARLAKKPITSVGRNLFTIRPELFPTVASAEAVSAPVAPGFWDVVEKSRSDQADQKKRRDILVEHLQREAAKLRLQSTVMGPEPQAIIGGTLVKEGSVIASDGPGSAGGGVQFRVLAIEARRVVVERQGIRLEIRMTQ
jgi:hypothetical protein